MQRQRVAATTILSVLCGILLLALPAQQQPATPPATQTPATPPAGRGGGRGGPAVVSPQIESDRRVTFRLLAPNASTVTVGGDINNSLVPDPDAPQPQPAPAGPQGGRGGVPPVVTMAKGENGVWSGSVTGDCPSRMMASRSRFRTYA